MTLFASGYLRFDRIFIVVFFVSETILRKLNFLGNKLSYHVESQSYFSKNKLIVTVFTFRGSPDVVRAIEACSELVKGFSVISSSTSDLVFERLFCYVYHNINKQTSVPLILKFGVSIGPVVSGVVGVQKPKFDIWGGFFFSLSLLLLFFIIL